MPFNKATERANREKFEEMLKLKSSMKSESAKPEPSGSPAVLTDYNFTQAVQNNPIMVVDFWAPWCAPCRAVSPVLEDLASQYAGQVAFGKLNVDDNPITAATFGIESIPTIMIFKNGKPVDGVVGAVPKSDIEGKIRSYLGEGDRGLSPYQ